MLDKVVVINCLIIWQHYQLIVVEKYSYIRTVNRIEDLKKNKNEYDLFSQEISFIYFIIFLYF